MIGGIFNRNTTPNTPQRMADLRAAAMERQAKYSPDKRAAMMAANDARPRQPGPFQMAGQQGTGEAPTGKFSGFMSAMANSDGFARGMHPSKSLWNIPGLQDAMVQRGIGRLPQQQVQQQAQPMNIYEYWKLLGEGTPAVWGQPDPLDALRRANLPLMGL